MELRDLVTRFEKSKPLIWFCPIVKCYCAHDCYAFRHKTFRFLYYLKDAPTYDRSQTWSQNFKNREDAIKWGKSLTYPIIVTSFYIDNECCAIIDKFLELGEDNA